MATVEKQFAVDWATAEKQYQLDHVQNVSGADATHTAAQANATLQRATDLADDTCYNAPNGRANLAVTTESGPIACPEYKDQKHVIATVRRL